MKPQGDISIKNIGDFYNELKNEISRSGEVLIDLSDVKRIDLAAAQLIIAAGKEARELKKVVRLTGVSPEMKKLLGYSGIRV